MKTLHTSVYKLAAVAMLSASLMIGGAMSAQAKPDGAKSEMRGKRRGGGHMQQLATKLNLSDSQKSQIQAITQRSRTDAQAVKSNTSLTQEQKRAQLKTIHTDARNAITSILTPAQRAELAQVKAERKASGKGKRGAKRGAKLNLTDAQKTQMASIRATAKANTSAVKANTSLSPEAKRTQLQTVRANTRAAIANILTPAQLQQLEETQAKRKNKRQGKRGARKGGQRNVRNNGLNN